MSLDIYFGDHEQNITHNLGKMANNAGIYNCLWRPEENGIKTAGDLIDPLREAIHDMIERPDFYKQFDASNGWGTYDDFLPWLITLFQAALINKDEVVRVSV